MSLHSSIGVAPWRSRPPSLLDATLHSRDGDLQELGDLAVGEATEGVEEKGCPVGRWQFLHSPADSVQGQVPFRSPACTPVHGSNQRLRDDVRRHGGHR
jgi:hypothetical protein